MKSLLIPLVAGIFTLATGVANAEQYTDYTPQKGAWHVTIVKVDPNHIDDYLVGLRKTWVPGEEINKRHGLIDSYTVQIKMNAADGGGNVLLIEHVPSLALMEPDKDRDKMIEKEVYDTMSKDKMQAQVRDYEKYRTFVGDEYWTDVAFPK
jgi:hypothetical protein